MYKERLDIYVCLDISLVNTCTLCGCEVPGIILLRDLKGAVRLDRSKFMSLQVSTCTIHDFNALTSAVWKLWR
jgi:hypothetical protein